MDFFLSFLLSLLFFFLYYRSLWISSKLRSKELKLSVKYGQNSKVVKRFRRKHFRFYHSKLFRFLTFSLFAFGVFKFFGKQGLLGFAIALLVANLAILPWGWLKTGKLNGENFSQNR